MLKKCTKCGEEKPIEEFWFKSKKSPELGRRSRCGSCLYLIFKEYRNQRKEYYNKKANESTAKRRLRHREYVFNYLLSHPCVDCFESDPIVLEFHHINPEKKSFTIGNAIQSPRSIETIQKEIDKCEVLCANCHKRRTAKEQEWFKYAVTEMR